MYVYYAIDGPRSLGPAVVAVSAFDGVHTEHQRLIHQAAREAARMGCATLAVMLWPTITVPDKPPTMLTTLDERLGLLAANDRLAGVLVMPYAGIRAAAGAHTLCARLDAWVRIRGAWVGADAVAQEMPEWSATAWAAAAAERGVPFATEDTPAPATAPLGTRIRAALVTGDVTEAQALLGHPYVLAGLVVAGDQRGRLLGVPTANLQLDPRAQMPANGVYALRVRLPGEMAATHAAVANIGVRPTFGGDVAPRVEVHLLDADLDLYGDYIAVEFAARLRAEEQFASVEALVAQMARDVARARDLLDAPTPPPWPEPMSPA